MKTKVKIEFKEKTFFIKSSSAYIYVSIEKSRNNTNETPFEFNVSKSRLTKIITGTLSLLGAGGVIAKFI
ncbi:hypothetical protein LCL96_15245 [Rossellomorea aquimaris]|uniref:hypothetical protein n=1 Tax=Rossellomorea aquimaris TaxID=189382 RepID=UPI001CD2DC5C|nr:hypothetical protein [Rossellomorea aquimaris]MCA1060293.1 hypothetical protein [Rossellomorea aquimaris]